MSDTNKAPDWFARTVAVVAIALTTIGLGLNYYNYRSQMRWQAKTYQESLDERILVRMAASRMVKNIGRDLLKPNGDLGVEVVNIGMHPIYIKKIEIQTPDRRLYAFYDRDPMKSKVPIKPLDPGQSVNYAMAWDFAKYPLQNWAPWNISEITSEPESKEFGPDDAPSTEPAKDLWIEIDTTKKAFRQHPSFTWISFSLPQKHGVNRHR